MVTTPVLGVDACGRPRQECITGLLALVLCLCLGIPYLWSRDECPMIICYTTVLGQLNVLVLLRGHLFGNVVTDLEARGRVFDRECLYPRGDERLIESTCTLPTTSVWEYFYPREGGCLIGWPCICKMASVWESTCTHQRTCVWERVLVPARRRVFVGKYLYSPHDECLRGRVFDIECLYAR
jgi:hypothetical protein